MVELAAELVEGVEDLFSPQKVMGRMRVTRRWQGNRDEADDKVKGREQHKWAGLEVIPDVVLAHHPRR